MIPPDLTDVSQESPREAIANLAQIFQGYAVYSRAEMAQSYPHPYHFGEWAARLRLAVRQLDAEQSPPESGNVAGFVKYIEDTRWHSFPVSLKEFKEAAHTYAIQCVGAVSPTAQDTPQ